MTSTLSILASWAESRHAMNLDASALARRRTLLWRRLGPTLSRTPAFRSLVGRDLRDWPVITPAQMRADYCAYNSLGLRDADLRIMAERSERAAPNMDGIAVGYSTGTSGSRGLFVTDATERASYLGQSIARLLPTSSLITGARIALFLRANNALYSDVRRGRWCFAYFPLEGALDAGAQRLQTFGPDVLVAPSHVLAGLARLGVALPCLRRCFYGAEPMGDEEREMITARLGVRPDPIYQATEGFLGAACRFGRLHLNDHTLHIELARVNGTQGFQPIVTDLCRTSQPVVRVMLDDFIELDCAPCRCGFAGRTIQPVQGRMADLWRFEDRIVTPSTATNAIERLLGPDAIWEAVASPSGVRVTAESVLDGQKLGTLLRHELNLPVPVTFAQEAVTPPFPKRRRIRWAPNG